MRRTGPFLAALVVPALLAGCSAAAPEAASSATTAASSSPAASSGTTGSGTAAGAAALGNAAGRVSEERPFRVTEGPAFDEPWAMTFLPDGRALVTERGGALRLVDVGTGDSTVVAGTPRVHAAGQGGLGDVALGPRFAQDRAVYLSWAEEGPDGTSGAAVGRARLAADGSRLEGLSVIWRQAPKVSGDAHYSHRIAVAKDGAHLFVSSGERQQGEPAQDPSVSLGKIIRMGLAGEEPQTWSLGHRNALGLAVDGQGRLWSSEMGPRGGDELNLVRQGANHGWPRASNGSQYSGEDIPDHRAGDGFVAPLVWWNPSISPSSLALYTGDRFPAWRGDAFIGALSGQALVRVDLDGERVVGAEQWDLGERIREVEVGPDGALWLLEDGDGGRLLRLDPA